MDNRNLRVSAWRRRIKERAIAYLGGKCIKCGYDRCADAMDFHHRDPTIKEFRIGQYAGGWKILKRELDKCDLLCANCHREVHYELKSLEVEEYRKAHPRKERPKRVVVRCGQCGKTKEVPPCKIKRSTMFFCNRKCKGLFARK